MNTTLGRLLLIGLFLLGCISQNAHGQQDENEAEKADPSPTTTVDPQIPVDQLEVLVKPLTKSELQVEADAWMELLRQKARQISAARLATQKTNLAINSEDQSTAKAAIEEAEAVESKAKKEADQATQTLQNQAQENLGIEQTQSAPEVRENEFDADAKPDTDEASATTESEKLQKLAGEKREELLLKVNVMQDERTAIADRLDVVLNSLEAKGGDVQEYRDYSIAVSGIEIDTSDAGATWSAITGWLASKEGGQRWAWNFFKFVMILVVAYLVSSLIARIVNWLLERKLRLSQLAEKLISRSIKNIIMVIGLAIALTALEIDITPIVAAIGAAGLVIGLALQGTLSNFASGLLILINRPFDEGDTVSAGGVTGSVNKMNLVSTTFRTFDNQTIHVPNNEIWNNVITNITANDNRRVDLEFGIGYEDDFEEAEQIIRDVVEAHEFVLKDPEPVIVMHELADSSVNIVCRPWAQTGNWWKVKTDITRRVKKRFDEAGISIPYPQRDVHVYQHGEANAAGN